MPKDHESNGENREFEQRGPVTVEERQAAAEQLQICQSVEDVQALFLDRTYSRGLISLIRKTEGDLGVRWLRFIAKICVPSVVEQGDKGSENLTDEAIDKAGRHLLVRLDELRSDPVDIRNFVMECVKFVPEYAAYFERSDNAGLSEIVGGEVHSRLKALGNKSGHNDARASNIPAEAEPERRTAEKTIDPIDELAAALEDIDNNPELSNLLSQLHSENEQLELDARHNINNLKYTAKTILNIYYEIERFIDGGNVDENMFTEKRYMENEWSLLKFLDVYIYSEQTMYGYVPRLTEDRSINRLVASIRTACAAIKSRLRSACNFSVMNVYDGSKIVLRDDWYNAEPSNEVQFSDGDVVKVGAGERGFMLGDKVLKKAQVYVWSKVITID